MKNQAIEEGLRVSIRSLVRPRRRFLKTIIFVVICISLTIVFNIIKAKFLYPHIDELHKSIVDQFYNSRQSWRLSELGAVLYKNEDYPEISEKKKNKRFTILIWKYWHTQTERHIFQFGKVEHDPLKDCSVTNCEFTGNDDVMQTADAVIVHLQRGHIPSIEKKNRSQKWIFLNDESPYNVFGFAPRKINLTELHNVFNWSMMYSSNADIPIPYGRTVALKTPKFSSSEEPSLSDLVPYWSQKRRDVLAAILTSNCVPYRIDLAQQLSKYTKVNIHGSCGEDLLLINSCPGHFKVDCKLMNHYLFYLALENAKCKMYMTEKLFYNAYSKGAIPIIQGASVEECKQYLPPNSYLHVDNYATPKDLADDIIRISKDDKALLHYHKWRNHFEVVNEHGYFGTRAYHLCRVCEAMNYNDDTESVYSVQHIRQFLDPGLLCRG